MTTGEGLPVFEVHVAGEPAGDHIQRCVACGAVLIDNRPWWEGRVAVPVDDAATAGPSWWPVGALVATDKRRDGTGGGMTYTVDGRGLADDERPCDQVR